MSWGTDLFCNIYFSRETFNSKESVEDLVRDTRNMIEHVQDKIRTLSYMTEPKKFYNDNEFSSPTEFIDFTLKECFSNLEEAYIDLYRYELLLENWDKCHKDGLAIPPPEELGYDFAYLDGDYIKTIKTEENETN